ncbi:MAG: DUF456 domain-containing protein [Planctomycetota bacterium]|nr:DUF456 domain-containing protein [Planctomycetota bacterium]
MIYLWIILFILLLIVLWLTNLLGLPGNWLMILAAGCWTLWVGESFSEIGWLAIVAVLFLAVMGELLEFGASVLGTKQVGGSRRAAALSVIGSIVGGIVGIFFGLPIPVIGWIVGSLLFACLGALVGAALGERWQGSDMNASLKVGGAAFVGRLVGTVGKIAFGAVILVIVVLSLFF